MANFVVRNERELRDLISIQMKTVVQKVSAQLVETVKKNVDAVVYEPYTDHVRSYERQYKNGGFYDSWTYQMEEVKSGFLTSVILSDPERMVFDPARLIHGTDGSRGRDEQGDYLDYLDISPTALVDRRDIMDRAIAEGTDYDIYPRANEEPAFADDYWWTRPRDYWTPSLEEIDASFEDVVNYFMNEQFQMPFR